MDFATTECVVGGIFLCISLTKQISIFTEKILPLYLFYKNLGVNSNTGKTLFHDKNTKTSL